MLYQLSYEPQTAGAVGLEPTTFELEARHSIQLSYAPKFFVSLRDSLRDSCARAYFPCKLSEHCVFSVTRGTPPMSYYTLFKGWLPLSQPAGFMALLVLKRPLILTAVPFLLY